MEFDVDKQNFQDYIEDCLQDILLDRPELEDYFKENQWLKEQ